MVLGIIGENCSGKSTLAKAINQRLNAKVYSGSDYLRLAKNEAEARKMFIKMLSENENENNIIYVVTEPEQLDILPDNAIKILVKTDIETIKDRFRERMHGTLPRPVEMMLERKHGIFDDGQYDFVYDGTSDNIDLLCDKITVKGIGAA